MSSVRALSAKPEVPQFKTDELDWHYLKGGPEFDYHIDYSLALLGADPKAGRCEFLVRWESDAYCHYHRHIGDTTILVLEGEHHVVETSPTETVHKTRTAGHYAHNPGGDVHMEYAGPQGTLVYFSMHTPDGRLFDIL